MAGNWIEATHLCSLSPMKKKKKKKKVKNISSAFLYMCKFLFDFCDGNMETIIYVLHVLSTALSIPINILSKHTTTPESEKEKWYSHLKYL